MTAIITDVHYRMSVALIRDLRQSGLDVITCETQAYPQAAGFASKYSTRSVLLPVHGTLDALYTLCQQVQQQAGEKPVLFPVGAATLYALSKEQARFEAVCCMAIPTPQQLDTLNDKSAVMRLAKSLGIAVPDSYERQEAEDPAAFAQRVALPCVVKPLCGEKFGLQAQARYAIVHTQQELLHWYAHFQQLTGQAPLVQQYLSGGGQGCSVLASQGQVLASICHRRIREYPIAGGPSSCCQTIQSPQMLDAAQRLMAATHYTGIAMVEFKLDAAGVPHLLEINPRVWGTYPLTRVSGSNFSLMWCCLAQGTTLPPYCPPQQVRMVYYPSDFAAMLHYLRAGKLRKALQVLGDWLRPAVKNGLRETGDPGPYRAYWRSLVQKGRPSC